MALGYRSELEFYATVADRRAACRSPPCFYCEISDDGADFVLLLADMAPAVQGDQIARLQRRRGDPRGRGARRAARAQLVRSECGELPGHRDAQARDAAAAKGFGEVAVMATEITLDKLGDG